MSTSDSPSSGPTLLLGLLIGGAALLALGLSGPGPAPQPKSPAAPAPARPPDAPGPAPSALHGPLAPLYDFFHVADPCELPDRLGECSLEVLIATVPDPVDTVFDTSLDLYLGALQNALGIVRFVADRHYLPWDEKAAREQRRYRFEPGTVLFRDESLRRVGREQNLCRDRRERLLLVFLVGESPVTGIHKAAFAESVRLARMLCPELGELPVLSPCYSGSARSLIQALNAGKSSEKGLKFRVIAGGATNVNQEDFEKAAGTEFRSMRVHARVIKQELIHFVAHRNPGGVKIAWLSESNTAYGRIPVTPGDADGEGEPSGGGGVEDLAQVVEFPFPMHISRVRTAYG
ncbi:MAG TPA: hypothetical protein VIL46_18045, partial [Gemmataceae bacterium]